MVHNNREPLGAVNFDQIGAASKVSWAIGVLAAVVLIGFALSHASQGNPFEGVQRHTAWNGGGLDTGNLLFDRRYIESQLAHGNPHFHLLGRRLGPYTDYAYSPSAHIDWKAYDRFCSMKQAGSSTWGSKERAVLWATASISTTALIAAAILTCRHGTKKQPPHDEIELEERLS